ncbi:MAG: type II toxin-antitoxin system RelE/ParE family toxin [Candidatus Korobacteraceae bacterium]
MPWEIEVTQEFEAWWELLEEAEREDVRAAVGLLEERGPALPFPYCSGVVLSRHDRMRELRVQHRGRPYRVLYAF